MVSRFSDVKMAPKTAVEKLSEKFAADPNRKKINLAIESCRTENGTLWGSSLLKNTELKIASDVSMNHEYFHPLGLPQFTENATKFLLGNEAKCFTEKRAFGVQTLGVTSGLNLAIEFLVRQLKCKHFYLSSPTSDNIKWSFYGHKRKIQIGKYSYWNSTINDLDFEGLISDLRNAPEDAVIVLQMCSHNPTCQDLSKRHWVEIANVMQERNLFPLFESSNQGLASGDADEDAWPVRYFASRGFEMICVQSFSTNFGLYDARIGNLTFIVNDTDVISSILVEATWNFYNIYGTPAQHGAKVVLSILEDSKLYNEWKINMKMLIERMRKMRSEFQTRMEDLGMKFNSLNHITNQRGLFSYIGLTRDQIEYLMKKHHVYITESSWINMSALNYQNIDYVVQAIHDTMLQFSCTNSII